MTREQAIEHGKSQLEVFGGEHREFIELAVKALEHEQKIEKIVNEWSKDLTAIHAMIKIKGVLEDDDIR